MGSAIGLHVGHVLEREKLPIRRNVLFYFILFACLLCLFLCLSHQERQWLGTPDETSEDGQQLIVFLRSSSKPSLPETEHFGHINSTEVILHTNFF